MNPDTKAAHAPLAIVGLACRFPQANDHEEYWHNIKHGVDSITDIPESHWSTAEYFDEDPKAPDMTYGRKGGFLSPIDFDPLEFGISPHAIEATDTSQLLALLAARDALKDAGYGDGGKPLDRDKVSVILGITGTLELVVPLGARLGHPIWRRALEEAGVDPETTDDVVARIGESYVGWQEASFPGLLGNVVAGRIANRLDLGGTNCVVDAACASSLSALHLAALELAAGRTDLVLTGGVDTFNDIFMYMCFSKTPALSPTGNARPFAKDGDGTTLGEGVGILALKRLEDAERDGDRVYAVLKGVGSASDGRGNAIYAPDSSGQAKALRRAYENADVSPDTIELLEAHGTGTAVGDATEARGLRSVFDDTRRKRPWCAIGSVKSQIGHTKAAAGVAGLIKATLALHHKVLPPTIKVDQPVDELGPKSDSPFYLTPESRPWLPNEEHPRRAAVSSFGFGGSNFHCVLEESASEKVAPDWTGEVQIVALSGDSGGDLKEQLSDWQKGREWSWDKLRDRASASRRAFSGSSRARLVFVIHRSETNLAATVRNLRAMLESRGDGQGWTTPEGASCQYGPCPGKLAFLFPGQGAQYVGMGRELACHFPEPLRALAVADEAFWKGRTESSGRSLSDVVYPQPQSGRDTQDEDEATLRATDHAQPALGAIEVSLLEIVRRFGLEADAFAGHSYGELTALYAAGVISEPNLHQLSNFRGRLMAAGSGDRGSMLAVPADAKFLSDWLGERGFDLTIANMNTPKQTILSGLTSEIVRAGEALQKDGIRTRRLPVAAAFHSPLVAGAAEPFAEVLNQIRFENATGSIYANTTGAPYPAASEAAKTLLAQQLAKPVRFVDSIENMAKSGVHTFLEIGPGARVSGMVRTILDGQPHHAVSVDASQGKKGGLRDLAVAIAQVAALGHGVRLEEWDPRPEATAAAETDAKSRRPKFTVKLSGANYRKPFERRPRRERKLPKPRSADAPSRKLQPDAAVTPGVTVQPSAVVPSSTTHAASNRPEVSSTQAETRATAPRPNPAALASRPAQPEREIGGMEPRRFTDTPNDLLLEQIRSLKELQAQTAQIHAQFLEGQQRAHESFTRLVEGSLIGGNVPAMRSPEPPTPPSRPISTGAPSTSAQYSPPSVQNSPVQNSPASDTPVSDTQSSAEAVPASVQRGSAMPTVSPTRTSDDSALRDSVMNIVSDKTGYPREVLDLDMNLEADLGIDSIKRVEILAAVQDAMPHVDSVGADELGSLHTLREVVARLSADSAAASSTGATPFATATAAPVEGPSRIADTVAKVEFTDVSTTDWEAVLFRVVADKTGYPTEILSRDMHLEADLGIDSIKRVEILSALTDASPELQVLSPETLSRLSTLDDVLREVASAVPAAGAATPGKAESPSRIPTSPDRGPGVDPAELLAIVSDKTGYPAELIDLDMELEADLGIDSIKRVEIMSAYQDTRPTSAPLAADRLGQLRTLREVLAAVEGAAVEGAAVEGAAVKEAAVEEAATAANPADSLTPARTVTPPGDATGSTMAKLEASVLTIVADKTGYPAEALELDLELEADLGIDSIKRVEILSALQDRWPHLPTVGADEAGQLRSLRDLVGRLESVGNGSAETHPPPAVVQTVAVQAADPVAVGPLAAEPNTAEPRSVDATDALEGYPTSLDRHVVRLQTVPAHHELGAPLGLGSGDVWVVGAPEPTRKSISRAFESRGLTVRHYALSQAPRKAKAKALAGCLLLGTETSDLVAALSWAQRARAQFDAPAPRRGSTAGRPFVASVTALDGAFGFAGLDAHRSVSPAAFTGLLKTARHEWSDLSCRAFDIDPSERFLEDRSGADRLVDECLRLGPSELGFRRGERILLDLVEDRPEPSPPGDSRPLFDASDVVVITGGARGVTAAVAQRIAESSPAKLVLWGRSPRPKPEEPELAGLTSEAELKPALFARYGTTRKPREIQQEVTRILRERESLAHIAAIEATGTTVTYQSVDVRDPKSVGDAMAVVERDLGPVTGLIHGAGVLRDRHLAELTEAEFWEVYRTKVDGLEAVMSAAPNIETLVVFSSTTARLGRVGQAAYAMANEVLNKWVARERVRRPKIRAVSLNWGPWDGGMVTPALRDLFASEGVGLIPLVAGSDALRFELLHPSADSEIVVLGKTDLKDKPAAPQVDSRLKATESTPADLREVASWSLDPRSQDFLDHHRLAGKCVLPIALMVEWIAEAALHAQPGYQLVAIEEFQLLQGLRLSESDSVSLRGWVSRPVPGADGTSDLQVELRTNAAHARAKVRLGNTPAASQRRIELPSGGSVAARDAYRQWLFHGPAWQMLDRVERLSSDGVEGVASTTIQPSDWLSRTRRRHWVTQPLALDATFQLLIVWTQSQLGLPSLPCAFQRLEVFTSRWPANGARVVARVKNPTHASSGLVRADIEILDSSGNVLARLDDYQSATSADLVEAFRSA